MSLNRARPAMPCADDLGAAQCPGTLTSVVRASKLLLQCSRQIQSKERIVRLPSRIALPIEESHQSKGASDNSPDSSGSTPDPVTAFALHRRNPLCRVSRSAANHTPLFDNEAHELRTRFRRPY